MASDDDQRVAKGAQTLGPLKVEQRYEKEQLRRAMEDAAKERAFAEPTRIVPGPLPVFSGPVMPDPKAIDDLSRFILETRASGCRRYKSVIPGTTLPLELEFHPPKEAD